MKNDRKTADTVTFTRKVPKTLWERTASGFNGLLTGFGIGVGLDFLTDAFLYPFKKYVFKSQDASIIDSKRGLLVGVLVAVPVAIKKFMESHKEEVVSSLSAHDFVEIASKDDLPLPVHGNNQQVSQVEALQKRDQQTPVQQQSRG